MAEWSGIRSVGPSRNEGTTLMLVLVLLDGLVELFAVDVGVEGERQAAAFELIEEGFELFVGDGKGGRLSASGVEGFELIGFRGVVADFDVDGDLVGGDAF